MCTNACFIAAYRCVQMYVSFLFINVYTTNTCFIAVYICVQMYVSVFEGLFCNRGIVRALSNELSLHAVLRSRNNCAYIALIHAHITMIHAYITMIHPHYSGIHRCPGVTHFCTEQTHNVELFTQMALFTQT